MSSINQQSAISNQQSVNKAIKSTAFPSLVLWFNATQPKKNKLQSTQFMPALYPKGEVLNIFRKNCNRLLSLIFFVILFMSKANSCFIGHGGAPYNYLDETSSVFVARLLEIIVLKDQQGYKYVEAKVEIVEHIYGEILSENTVVYIRENEYESIYNYDVPDKYIIATVNGTYADKSRLHVFSESYHFSVAHPDTQWVIQHPCRTPFIVRYSKEKLDYYTDKLEDSIMRSEQAKKDKI